MGAMLYLLGISYFLKAFLENFGGPIRSRLLVQQVKTHPAL